jgi:hypothetical protein
VRQVTLIWPGGSAFTGWVSVTSAAVAGPLLMFTPSGPAITIVLNSAFTGPLKDSVTAGRSALIIWPACGFEPVSLACAEAGAAGSSTTASSPTTAAVTHFCMEVIVVGNARSVPAGSDAKASFDNPRCQS